MNTISCTGLWDTDGAIDSNWQLTVNGTIAGTWGLVNVPCDSTSFDVTDDVAQDLIDGNVAFSDVLFQ